MTYLDVVAAAIRRHVPAGTYPDEGADALFRNYAVLALAKGGGVTARDVHDAWSAWMQERDPSHRSLRPFEQLDALTRSADTPFVEAIHEAVRELAASDPRA